MDSVGFVEVPEFFLESAIEQEITEEKIISVLAEQTVGIEDGDEIIDLGDDREAILAEIRGSKENEVQETEVQDTSGQDVQKQKPEVEITLTVAECGEFHNMGEFYENIPTVEEAIALFEKIPPERISDILREIITEGVVPEEVERAKELLDKLSEYKPLAKVEEVEEQNYNMIDNVLNNGAEKTKKEADRKEMDKPRGRVSLKERLAEKKAIIAGNDKAAETQENVKKNQREM